MTPDKEGNLPPSALVPFCSYQGNSSLLGQERPELDNMTVCDKFEPTILEDQFCYSLDMAKLKETPSTKPGKANGLFLLLDPNRFQPNVTDEKKESSSTEDQSFKVYIHTLGQYTTLVPGSYGMSTLKKMAATKSFQQLPVHQKECLVGNTEECQTEKYLKKIERECKCTPWDLQTDQGKNQASAKFLVK